jgi:hypothetical protein
MSYSCFYSLSNTAHRPSYFQKTLCRETVFVHVLVEYSYGLEGLTCPIDPPPLPPPPYQLFLLYWIPFLYWISGGGAGYE